jgi:hypothetical protein
MKATELRPTAGNPPNTRRDHERHQDTSKEIKTQVLRKINNYANKQVRVNRQTLNSAGQECTHPQCHDD